MEEHRDEQIRCADCGASFVFSADEAVVFAQRGLTPPKRCKECRRARKDRAASERNAGGAPPWDGRGGGRPPRYTGDVNEYRSPMQDTYAPQPPRVVAGPRGSRAAGEYARPMLGRPAARASAPREDGNVRPGAARSPLRGPRPGAAPPHDGEQGASAAPGGGARAARRRAPAALFRITCDACGVEAEVPFEPAQGREVFCPTCYRARRAPS